MTNYVWVCEIKKNKEYVPYVARKRHDEAELVKQNNERCSDDKYRVERYVREKKKKHK